MISLKEPAFSGYVRFYKYLSLETIFSEILYLQFHSRSFFLSLLITYLVIARFSRGI